MKCMNPHAKKPCTFNWREIGHWNPNNRLISKTALLPFLFLGYFSIQYVILRSKVAKPMIFKSNENEMLWRDETKAEKLCIFPKMLNVLNVSVIMKRKIRKRKVTREPTPKLNSCIIPWSHIIHQKT